MWLQSRLHKDAARKMRQIPHFFVSGSQDGGVVQGRYKKIREHELLYEVEEKRHIERKSFYHDCYLGVGEMRSM